MIHFCNNVNPLIETDHSFYNHLVSAWVMNKQPKSAELSDWWLRRIWEEYNETGNEIIGPKVHTYNKVMADFHN